VEHPAERGPPIAIEALDQYRARRRMTGETPHVEHESLTGELDRDLLARGLAALAEKVPAPGAVTVVVAGDLASSVRSRLGDAAEGQGFSDQRHIGTVAGKTLRAPGGKATVVLSAELLYRGSPQNTRAVRLFAHEGGHVALHQRGESSSGVRERRSLRTAEGWFAELGAHAIEEYRIQSALRERGLRCYDIHLPSLPNTLATIVQGFRAAYYRQPLAFSYQDATECFHNLVTKLAYVAAEVPSAPPEVSQTLREIAQTAEWARLVGPSWQPFLTALAGAPFSDTPWDQDTLDAASLASVPALRDWFRHVGFTMEDRPTSLYFTRDGW